MRNGKKCTQNWVNERYQGFRNLVLFFFSFFSTKNFFLSIAKQLKIVQRVAW